MTIDVTTGSTESGSFSQYDAGGNLLDTYETITIQREIGSAFYETIFHDINSGSVESILQIPGGNLVGYEGGQICSLSQECSGNWTSGNPAGAVQSGSLTLDTSGDPTPVAATPEPSSLALLGTGLLGVAGLSWRRFLRA